jgi:hypothetical protein
MSIDFVPVEASSRDDHPVHEFGAGNIYPKPLESCTFSHRTSAYFINSDIDSLLGGAMKRTNLAVLKFFALLFLFPGLGGLVFSAMVSTDYLENLPKSPAPIEQRMTPRNVHGVVIYQTVQEDTRLSIMEYTSVSIFLVGLILGIVYLEKWSTSRQLDMEVDSDLLEEAEA